MTLQYDKAVAALYNQQLQQYQSKIVNDTISQTELNQAKEIASQYYQYLNQSGIEYGRTANEVIQSSTFYGAFANGMLKDALEKNNPNASASQIQFKKDRVAISLVFEDSFLRKETENGNLSSRAIADYHYNVFAINNLPKEAWGGAIFEEFLGAGSWMNVRDDKTSFIDDIVSSWIETRFSDKVVNDVSKKEAIERILDFSSGVSASGQGLENLATDIAEAFQSFFNDITQYIDTINSALSSAYEDFATAVANAIRRTDPLIIDLDNNGLQLSSWQTSNVLFDLNRDGVLESTGWFTRLNPALAESETNKVDDAFLVIDKNNNGNVDNIDELFGNDSINGFDELRRFDSNADNKINSSDSQFGLLKIWQDRNVNDIFYKTKLNYLSDNKNTEIFLSVINY